MDILLSASRAMAELVFSLAAPVGSVAVALALLNRRDRRRAALIGQVCAELPSAVVRSDIAVDAGSGLIVGGDWVRVDLGLQPANEVWAAIARLRRALPARVRLTVDGRLAGRESARLTVERVSDRASLRPAA